jgi:hypothetical protein
MSQGNPHFIDWHAHNRRHRLLPFVRYFIPAAEFTLKRCQFDPDSSSNSPPGKEKMKSLIARP